MIIMPINTMGQSTIMKMMSRKFSALIITILCILLLGCSGMREPGRNLNIDLFKDKVNIEFKDIDYNLVVDTSSEMENYKISRGDVLSIVVFGLDEFFPITYSGVNNPYTSKLVDEKGFIFFPYAGYIKAEGLTVAEVRDSVTKNLSVDFNQPQVDVSITEFNSKRNVYVLGEINNPSTIQIGLVPVTLADAISSSKGLSNITSNPKDVYVIRTLDRDTSIVYRANLQDASAFALSGQFTLRPGDIVFIGAANITKWNRFITQLFPFASFLNQIDSIQR